MCKTVVFFTAIGYVLHIACMKKLCMNRMLLSMRGLEGFKLLSKQLRCTFKSANNNDKHTRLCCIVCQKTKYDRGKQPGLLQPFPISDSPCKSISMDFIFELPSSIHGNTRIWTIVDRFRHQAHFIPVKKTIKVHHMATLFILQVFKYHGLSKNDE